MNDDYKEAYNAVEMVMFSIREENAKLKKALKYYAETEWKEVSQLDRGQKAREALK